MKRLLFAVSAIIIATLLQSSFPGRQASALDNPNLQTGEIFLSAGDALIEPKFGTSIIRVTGEGEAQAALVAESDYSSFNADSTRFFINIDGVPTLYGFDPETLKVQRQGPLFDDISLQLDGCYWSANDSETIFGIVDSEDSVRLYAYNVRTRSYKLLKNFSDVLSGGNARGFSKSWTNDERFAFSWRESDLSSWHYAVVWDRSSDLTHMFDVTDLASGVPGYRQSRLSKRGDSLTLMGDVTREWRYQNQSQSKSILVKSDLSNRSWPLTLGDESEANLRSLSELINGDDHPAIKSVSLPHSNVSRDGRFRLFNARSTTGQVDAFISTIVTHVVEADTVTWTNLVNTTPEQNTVRKTAGLEGIDDASATSIQSVSSGDAYMEFTVTDKKGERWAGLSSSNEIHENAGDIDFAIKLIKKKKYEVREKGVLKHKGKYKTGDTFRLAIEEDIVKYYLKGNLIYTSDAQIEYPLLVSASLLNRNSVISEAMIAGASIRAVISISPSRSSLFTGDTQKFTARVTGSHNTNIVWSATGGTISNAGFYTAPQTAGTYTVRAASEANPSIGANARVTVRQRADTTPPVISGVTASGITSSEVEIDWTTNEPADTQVEYGTTTAYGNLSILDPSMVTSHSVGFGGLLPNTLYHFRVRSRDASGNQAVSGNFTFTTLAEADTAPPVISNVASSDITESGAAIGWRTNEASSTQVEYGTTANYGSSTSLNASMVTNHSATLSGLSPATLYHYRVRSRDAAGNLAVSGDFTFTTSSSGGGGGGSTQNVVWTNVVRCSVNGSNLQKNSGFGDTPDAGARSQQAIMSGNGYIQFAAAETNKTRFCGWADTVTGTSYDEIDFGIKLTDFGVAEVRENNVYKSETTYRNGDVFRIAVESGQVKYYKNGSAFYTSQRAPNYPMIMDAVLIGLNGTINDALIAATSGGALASAFDTQQFVGPDSSFAGAHYAIIREPFPVPAGEFDRLHRRPSATVPRWLVIADALRNRSDEKFWKRFSDNS